MPLAALEAVLENRKGGVYFAAPTVDAKAVARAARAAGYEYFHIDGRNIARKEQLLNAMATALDLPPHFGHNWDALEECLNDMDTSDGDGFLIHYDLVDALASSHPSELETLVEIFRDSVESWREDGTPMLVLLTGARAPKGVAKLNPKSAA
jgi:RNAse (barnase) inhibitor barstar